MAHVVMYVLVIVILPISDVKCWIEEPVLNDYKLLHLVKFRACWWPYSSHSCSIPDSCIPAFTATLNLVCILKCCTYHGWISVRSNIRWLIKEHSTELVSRTEGWLHSRQFTFLLGSPTTTPSFSLGTACWSLRSQFFWHLTLFAHIRLPYC